MLSVSQTQAASDSRDEEDAMPRRSFKILALSSCLLCSVHSSAQAHQGSPDKYALLIGIDEYDHSADQIKAPDSKAQQIGRFAPDMTYPDLQGPDNDVDSIRKVLISKFHFSDDPGHMKVLLDAEATHDALIAAMQKYLVDLPHKDDTAVLYVSSHGSLRIYARGQGEGQLYNLLGNESDQRHAENTLVPYDWYTGVDDVFSRDLRHFFREAADKGVHVTAIFDTCHSGSLGRAALSGKLVSRDFDFDGREMTPNPYAREERPTLPQDDPLTPVLILSAAQKDQLAIEDQTSDPHGVFTRALVEALNALPADRPVSDVFSRLQVSMELAPNSIHQQPELDTSPERRRQPIFGGEVAQGPTTAAVVQVNSDGVLLDIGIVADIGPGSLFTTMPTAGGTPVELKVTQSLGLGRSLAQIQTPGGKVEAKDIVQLKAAVPWQWPDLLVYTGASNPSLAEVQDALAAVVAAHITLVPDPSRDPWNYHIYWDAGHWMLNAHSKSLPGIVSKPQLPSDIGARLTPRSLSRIPGSSAVWFDPPLPKEVSDGLFPPSQGDEPPISAKLTTEREKAVYVIGARVTVEQGNAAISFAWFKRADVDAEVQTPDWMGDGCSPGSSYPLRTDWSDSSSPDLTAAALTKFAVKLAKLNGWFLLQSSPLSGHSQFPYTLALRPTESSENIGENGTTYSGKYYLELVGNPAPTTQPQWVYVLNISCEGDGIVVWPYDGDSTHKSQDPAKFPVDDSNKLANEIQLPGEPFPVAAPFGTDTYLLLTTSTPLSNYRALNFDGVVGSKGATNPLEDLLFDTSSGTRETTGPIPTNWGLWAMQVQSLPDKTKPPQ